MVRTTWNVTVKTDDIGTPTLLLYKPYTYPGDSFSLKQQQFLNSPSSLLYSHTLSFIKKKKIYLVSKGKSFCIALFFFFFF